MSRMRGAFHTAVIAIVAAYCSVAAGCDDDASRPLPDPPAVSTGSALTIGQSSALVGGRIDPRGSSTTYWFEFGVDATYGESTGENSLAENTGEQTVDASLDGLLPATGYHYRLVAENDGGATLGEDATLVTLALNSPPQTQITAAPSDTLASTVRWHLFWFGMDTDGEVNRYELRVADHGTDGALDPPDTLGLPWTSTLVTDTLLTWEVGVGSRTAFVRSIDDREARDPTPASISVWAGGNAVVPD